MARVFIGNVRSVVMSEWCLNSAGIKVHFVPLDTNWLQIEKVYSRKCSRNGSEWARLNKAELNYY